MLQARPYFLCLYDAHNVVNCQPFSFFFPSDFVAFAAALLCRLRVAFVVFGVLVLARSGWPGDNTKLGSSFVTYS